MNSSEPFKHYTEKVCQQIRWKKAHGIVAQEIENHLIDQKNAYMAMGDSESTAEEKALLQMGDPVAVGAALDSTHKPAPQWGMLGLVMVLFAIGIFIQFLFVTTMDQGYHNHSIPMMAILFLLSLAAFVGMYFLDFSFFGKHPYVLPLLLLGIDLWSQFFGTWGGGKMWLTLGSFSVSPFALALPFPLAFCGLLYQQRKNGKRGYFISGIIAAAFTFLLLICHSASGVLIFLSSAGILMLAAARKEWFGKKTTMILLFFIMAAIVLFALLLFYPPFRYRYGLERIVSILFPDNGAYGIRYTPWELREMLSHAAFLGKGTAFSGEIPYLLQAPTMLRSDYLLAHLTYQYGWAVSIGLVLLLSVFLIVGFRKCLKQKSVLAQMVSLSILCTFAMEIWNYIAANLGAIYLAPIALPFLSYGTTALLLNMGLAGILLSTFRTGEVYQDNVKPVLSERKFIQWDDGKLIISFK